MNGKRFFLALLSVSVLLVSDICRYPQHLIALAGKDIHSAHHLYLAAQGGNREALTALGQYALQHQDEHWLNLAAGLGDAEALHQLAMQTTDEAEQRALLLKASEAGHGQSQYELALLSERNGTRVYWLQQAAQNDHLLAQISLHRWWLLQEQVDKAMPWLQKTAPVDADSALLLAKILWQQGHYQQARQHLESAQTQGQQRAQQYLNAIDRFHPQAGKTLVQLEWPEQCAMRVQFVANSLDSIIQADQFKTLFSQDQRLQSLGICVNEPVWIPEQELQCDAQWHGYPRLGCDLASVAELGQAQQFDHLVIFAREGKANVNNGIMFLDLTDSYQVFVHELAHFAGFIDEYPLSTELAEAQCQRMTSPNLVFVQHPDEIATLDLQHWHDLDSSNISLSLARTCNNHIAQAFKPVAETTFMEYHELDYIPDIYLAAWKAVIEEKTNLVPVYVNFAMYFEQLEEHDAAAFWWQKFREYAGIGGS